MKELLSLPTTPTTPTTPSKRTWWKLEGLDDPYRSYTSINPVPSDQQNANLVSSLLTTGNHAPAIDLDVPCQLVASRTPGHFHLYIDVEMPWKAYRKILRAMARAGVVQGGYYLASKNRKASFLRPPSIFAGTCTADPRTQDEQQADHAALMAVVKAVAGTSGEDDIDAKLKSVEQEVRERLVKTLDEIVSRRLKRAAWKNSNVPSGGVAEQPPF